MDFLDLKYFCAVAEEGSLSSAAHKLFYAQSNLSTRIMRLENEIGMALFYRSNHGVTLTPKGDLLYKYARQLLSLADETIAAVKDDETANTILHIGSMESAVVAYLSAQIVSFHQKNPNVAINIETGNSESVLQKVLEYKLDGAFVAGPINLPELYSIPIRTEKLCLIAPKNLAANKTTVELLRLPLLVFAQGCSYRKVLENWLADEGLAASNIYEFNTLNAIFASAAAGLGVALFPKACIEQYNEKDALDVFDVPEKFANVPTVFVYRKNIYITSALHSFIDLAASGFMCGQ